jgi:hypothetical protein
VLPVLHAGALLAFKEYALPPAIFVAKIEIFFSTCELSHDGHTTLVTALALKTSSSNG